MKRLLNLLLSVLCFTSMIAAPYPVGSGNGLTGTYWKGATNFDKEESSIFWGKRPQGTVATREFTRIDKEISFKWAMGNPFNSTKENLAFCIEWEGYLLAPMTSLYTFDFTFWDDGYYFALYDLENLETPLVTSEFWGTDFAWDRPDWVCDVNLEKNRFYKIVVRYYEHEGAAHAQLKWRIKAVSDKHCEIIPQSQLYTELPPDAIDYQRGNGDGIKGAYWKGATNFDKEEPELFWKKRPQGTVATKEFERVDNNIDFAWGNGNPFDDTMDDFAFCIEWNGYLLAPVTSRYVFDFTKWDNGFYFEIASEEQPDEIIAHNEFWGKDFAWDRPQWVCEADLEAGKYYRIKIRHYEDDNGAHAHFRWIINELSPVFKEIVPQSQLFTSLPTSGISSSAVDGCKTNITSDGIVFICQVKTDISIYDMMGNLVFLKNDSIGDVFVNLAPGFYICKTGDKTHKTLIN